MWKLDEILPIRRTDGSLVSDFRSAATWQAVLGKSDLASPTTPVSFDEFLSETHHRYYGRPWIMGQLYFEELVRRGLLPTHRVLDFGCGAGRVGIKLIPYLNSGHYYGIDPHLRSLVAFASYEARLHNLAAKAPCLIFGENFYVEAFDVKFDTVLDFATTEHFSIEQMRGAYTKLYRTMSPGARVFMALTPKLGVGGMKDLGFDLVSQNSVTYRLPAPAPSIGQLTDPWHEFVAV